MNNRATQSCLALRLTREDWCRARGQPDELSAHVIGRHGDVDPELGNGERVQVIESVDLLAVEQSARREVSLQVIQGWPASR